MSVSTWLYGFKVAILVAAGFEQSEMVGPKKALEEAGATVHIVSLVEGKVQGWDWYIPQPKDEFKVDVPITQANANDYDALMIPGGLNSPDDLRLDKNVIVFVKGFKDKPIASICHGQWVLINADLVRNKTLTSWPSIEVDLVNAGAHWVDREVVRDGNLVTSRNPNDISAFNKVMIQLFTEAMTKKKNSNVPENSEGT